MRRGETVGGALTRAEPVILVQPEGRASGRLDAQFLGPIFGVHWTIAV